MVERTSAPSASIDHGMVKRGGASTTMRSTIAQTTVPPVFCTLNIGLEHLHKWNSMLINTASTRSNLWPTRDVMTQSSGGMEPTRLYRALWHSTLKPLNIFGRISGTGQKSMQEVKGKARSKRRTPTSTITRPETTQPEPSTHDNQSCPRFSPCRSFWHRRVKLPVIC